MIPAHQQRVLDEHAELEKRITSLGAFMHTETYAGLDSVDQDHLDIQCKSMRLYSHVLALRITRFNLGNS